MKILLVNKFHYNKGGAETFYFGLAKELQKKGNEVIFFSMISEKNLDSEYSKYFVKNREYNMKTSVFARTSAFFNLVYSFEAKKKLKLLLEETNPDLIILNNIHRQITTSILDVIDQFNIPVFWILHDLILLCPCYTMLNTNNKICELCARGKFFNCVKLKCVKNSRVKSFLAATEAFINKKRHIYNKVDYFIAPSKFYNNIFLKYGFDENKLYQLSNPYFSTSSQKISSNFDYFLYFGRLSAEKGILNLINCFMESKGKKLVICGDGPLKGEIINLIKNNNYSKIEYLGFKSGEDLNEVISNCKCVIIPSEWYENSPYSGLEAMYFKKPLIVSNLGGLPELIDKNGFIFRNNVELVQHINFIEELSLDQLKVLGDNSYELLSKEHDPSHYVEKLLELYKEKVKK